MGSTVKRLLLALMGFAVAGTGPSMAQSDGTFKIGIANDMTSAYSDLTGKGSVAAVQMAIEDFGGTVLGKKIELLSADHQMKPSIGATLAGGWFDRDGVSMIVGVGGSSVAMAVQALAKDHPSRTVLFTDALSSTLIGETCIPNGIHWMPDSYALAASVTRYLSEQGTKTWFVMVQDTAAGPPALKAAQDGILAGGGKLVGSVSVPFNAGDVSSFVLQAQASTAQVIAVGFAGTDLINLVKAGQQFGLTRSGARYAAVQGLFLQDVQGMGLELAQGIVSATPFYGDSNEESKNWVKRFEARAGKAPNFVQFGDYEATMAYLQAVKRAGTDDARVVVPEMKKVTYNTFSLEGGKIRDDNQLIRPMYLYKVKSPAESKGPGDIYEIIGKIKAENAFSDITKSTCPMAKGAK